jgi:PRC-barrel domain
MKRYDTLNPEQARVFKGRDVFDRRDEKVGAIEAHWFDPSTFQVEFIGIKTGILAGQCHLVPARHVFVDETRESVRLDFSKDVLLAAPTRAPDAELAEVEKEEINAYYHEFTPLDRVTDIKSIRPEEALDTVEPNKDIAGAANPDPDLPPSEHTAVEQRLSSANLIKERIASAPEHSVESITNDQPTKNP